MVVVEDEISRPHKIEGNDEKPEERPYPEREKRQHGEQSRREIAIGRERSEARRQVRADDAGKQEDEPEEPEAVQGSDGTHGLHALHPPEPRQDIRAKAKAPRGVA